MKDWDDLRFFQAVAKAGSLSAGAKKLGVNASTVSRRVAGLEARLNTRLFDRAGKRYLLTESGEAVYSKLDNVAALIGEIEHSILGRDTQMRGLIRITCTPTVASRFLADAVQKFREQYPEVICDILVSTETYNLSSREVDIALRGTNNPPDFLIGKKLEVLHWGFYASKTYIDENPQSLANKADVNNPDSAHGRKQKLIAPSGILMNVPAYKWLAERFDDYDVVARVDNAMTMIEMAAKGIGIVLLSGFTTPDLIEIGRPDKKLQTTLWLLTHPELRGNVRIQTCMQFLHREYLVARGLDR